VSSPASVPSWSWSVDWSIARASAWALPDRPAQQEDEPAPADRDGRLGEQPHEAMVGLGVGGVGEVVRADVDVAVAAQELDQAQLCDIARRWPG